MSYPQKPSARFVPLVALALLASLMTATAASAAPQDIGGPGSDPDTEPHDPTGTPTAPPPSTPGIPPQGESGQGISDFEVRTDSVSAIAIVKYTDVKKVTVRWGDGTEDSVDIDSSGRIEREAILRNTAALKHTYDDNDGDSYQLFATVSVQLTDDSIRTQDRSVRIEPRYFITETATEFQPLDHCDSFVEDYTEYEITRGSNREDLNQKWEFNLITSQLKETEVLESASFYQEFSKAEAGFVRYQVVEKDPTSDDRYSSAFYAFKPEMSTGPQVISLHINKTLDSDCHAEMRFTIGHSLLRPTLSAIPIAGQPGTATPF